MVQAPLADMPNERFRTGVRAIRPFPTLCSHDAASRTPYRRSANGGVRALSRAQSPRVRGAEGKSCPKNRRPVSGHATSAESSARVVGKQKKGRKARTDASKKKRASAYGSRLRQDRQWTFHARRKSFGDVENACRIPHFDSAVGRQLVRLVIRVERSSVNKPGALQIARRAPA